MKLETCIDSLVSYAMNTGLSQPEDHTVLVNRILELLKLDAYAPSQEPQSEDLEQSLLGDFESDPERLWESNIFGKSLHELVNEGLQNKLLHMPQEARGRLQDTLEKVINDGCSGLICILL